MNNSGLVIAEIGGQKREIWFGLGATKQVCKYHNITLAQLTEKFGGLQDLFTEEIYGGLMHALAVRGKDPEFNYAEVMNWIDEMPQQALQDLLDRWFEVSQHGETRYEKFIKLITANDPNASAEKKKVAGNK